MKLTNIFKKPVDRTIEGVIKADDEASLKLEVEEYVLTNEIEKRIENFLDAYRNYEGSNGVWISGFFGSGKSHLLKMLALLLENRVVDGVPVMDMFLPKCAHNEILTGDIKKAVAIPSQSILFNIDQKADVISKTQVDALLGVFVKVFDETCGYYGKQGHIARFERDLDERGIYADFKSAYEAISSKEWERGREQALLEAANVASAYAKATSTAEEDAKGILDKYRKDYHVSIEDFAEMVKSYLDRQADDFRLNFFVDEVGQYIAENVKLMTNLQTIAESLATKCDGRAWVIVTAQEDMSTVIGDMTKRQSNDFSKIQDRFSTRMKLTSTNVAEVIQKRLLAKNEGGIQLLEDVYKIEANNFKTQFDFADGSHSYRNFKDRDHFIHSYPFIPYQFDLFQSAIQNLSQHNAFEGQHSSVGERSMLGVFQEVAKHISQDEVGQLATFDLMFEGIRTALKANSQRAILNAERDLDNDLAVRLLKALFLVKYVKEFKPTIRNLCILMLDKFGQDIPQQKKDIEEALSLLEQQTYIQRTGEIFEFLTDEEKDVEQEIKNTDIDHQDLLSELDKVIFEGILKQRKIRFIDNGQDYPFSRKLDDRLQGKEHELSINVITPFHEHTGNEETLRLQNLGKNQLLVVMPPDERLLRDLSMYKKTEKYVRQTMSTGQQDSITRILTDKQFQNRERSAEVRARTTSLLSKAKIMVDSEDADVGGEDPQGRMVKGFYELIRRAYPNLAMLRGINYSEDDVGKVLRNSAGGVFGSDGTSLAESEGEILGFVQTNARSGVRTTLKSLVEHFEKRPYGWYLAATLCTLASLCARGKIEIRSDGNVLEDKDLERAMLNTQTRAQLVLEPQVDYTASQVRALKEFFGDFFDSPAQSSEAKALAKEALAATQTLKEELKLLAAETAQFPFLNALQPVVAKLEELSGKSYAWFLTELSKEEKDLLDLKEEVVEPIRRFMSGSQKSIFLAASEFIRDEQANLRHVEDKTQQELQEILEDSQIYSGNRVPRAKEIVDELKASIRKLLDDETEKVIADVERRAANLRAMDDFSRLTKDKQAEIDQVSSEFVATIKTRRIIAVVRDELRTFQEQTYPGLLARLTPPIPPGGIEEAHPEYVSGRSIQVPFNKPWLADEQDLQEYVEVLRDAYLAELKKKKRIQV